MLVGVNLRTRALWFGSVLTALATVATLVPGAAQAHRSGCRLAGPYKHVIYVQFDNTHLTRDNPNVPSDLQQMPHLLNFLKDNGTVLNKHYTVLISHTAGGITSSLTGLYPDRQGTTVSNSYDYYNQQTGVPTYTSAFKYWTAPVAAGVDNHPNMVNGDSGQPKNTPAPWVTYTRAGCDVGNVSVANTVLENANAAKFVSGPSDLYKAAKAGDTSIDPYSNKGFSAGEQITIDQGANQETATIKDISGYYIDLTAPLKNNHAAGVQVWSGASPDPTGDLTAAFGAGTPEWQEGLTSQTAPYGSAAANKATTDFVGISVHCGAGGGVCNRPNSGATADKLPDEPGGYNGYKALFGAKYVDPVVTGGSAAVNDINGKPITDSFGQPGFPGFDAMPASTSLGYVAQMQESGIPVTYAYISDAHDNHSGGEGAFGPGDAGYVAQLKSYDDAFGKFFNRLAADGINKHNTLFVFTADENDHYAGQQAQNCDGVTTPCKYQYGQFDLTNGGQNVSTWTGPSSWPPSNLPLVGEVGYNINWLLGSTLTNKTPFDISFDSAPSFYINGQPQAFGPNGSIQVNPTLRDFEHAAANLKAFDPYVDPKGLSPVARYLADGPTLKALHMINADPQRTMSFTMFSQPDYYFQTYSPCSGKSQGCTNSAYAWIHGDYSNDIGQTWLGMVGPGVRDSGINDTTWTDHTDIVPTMNALLGLRADYTPDGRAITQVISPTYDRSGRGLQSLGDLYKQLDAPYGAFDHWMLVASTYAIKADDATYQRIESGIQSLTAQRDVLVAEIRNVLYGQGSEHGYRAGAASAATRRSGQLMLNGRVLLAQMGALARK